MDTLFELLPLLLLLLFGLLGGRGKKKTKPQPRTGSRSVGRKAPPGTRPAGREAEAGASAGPGTKAGAQAEPETSEGLIPADLWEELASIGGGERPGSRPQPSSAPGRGRESPPPEPETSYDTKGTPRFGEEETEAVPRYEKSGEVAVSPASEAAARPVSTYDEADIRGSLGLVAGTRTPRPGVSARASRAGRRSGAVAKSSLRLGTFPVGELRRAILLHEILGPPKSLRDPLDPEAQAPLR